MADEGETKTLWTGRHLSILASGGWECVSRNTQRPAVGIVAVTDDDKVVLVQQHRVPVGADVIELPAGLAGDIAGAEQEPLIEAAKRELLEETGYTARDWTELIGGYSSPGLTDESLVIFLASGLTKTGIGGGDKQESITVHEIPRSSVLSWLQEHSYRADLKLLAGLYAAENHIKLNSN